MASAKFSASNSVDYAGFKDRNGKHLVYVGMGDPLINPAGVIRWYQQLIKANEGLSATQKFARLFIVPGMSHTTGGKALDVFDPAHTPKFLNTKVMVAQTLQTTSNVKFPNAQQVDVNGQRHVRFEVLCLWLIGLHSEVMLDATPEC